MTIYIYIYIYIYKVILRKIYKNMEEGVPEKIHGSGEKLTKNNNVSFKSYQYIISIL
jgi:hypothetical protein